MTWPYSLVTFDSLHPKISSQGKLWKFINSPFLQYLCDWFPYLNDLDIKWWHHSRHWLCSHLVTCNTWSETFCISWPVLFFCASQIKTPVYNRLHFPPHWETKPTSNSHTKWLPAKSSSKHLLCSLDGLNTLWKHVLIKGERQRRQNHLCLWFWRLVQLHCPGFHASFQHSCCLKKTGCFSKTFYVFHTLVVWNNLLTAHSNAAWTLFR